MSEILELLKGSFASKRNQLRSVEVPSINRIIYYKAMTQEERERIFEGRPSPQEVAYRSFLIRSLDENGKPLFKQVHSLEIRKHVDPDVIDEVFIAMNKEELSEDEAAKK